MLFAVLSATPAAATGIDAYYYAKRCCGTTMAFGDACGIRSTNLIFSIPVSYGPNSSYVGQATLTNHHSQRMYVWGIQIHGADTTQIWQTGYFDVPAFGGWVPLNVNRTFTGRKVITRLDVTLGGSGHRCGGPEGVVIHTEP